MDDIGNIRPERPSTSPKRDIKYSNSIVTAGTTIAMAIIISALIGVGGWIGYIEYSAYKIEQQAKADALKSEERARIARQRAAEIAEQRRRESDAARHEREMHARECRYWQRQYQQHKTPEIQTMVRKHCNR